MARRRRALGAYHAQHHRTCSVDFLNAGQVRTLLKAIRADGVKPPKVGWCVKTLGGEVCHHPEPRPKRRGWTGWQVLSIRDDVIRPCEEGDAHLVGDRRFSHGGRFYGARPGASRRTRRR